MRMATYGGCLYVTATNLDSGESEVWRMTTWRRPLRIRECDAESVLSRKFRGTTDGSRPILCPSADGNFRTAALDREVPRAFTWRSKGTCRARGVATKWLAPSASHVHTWWEEHDDESNTQLYLSQVEKQ